MQPQRPPEERDLEEFPSTTQEFVRYGRAPHIAIEEWFGAGFTVPSDIEPQAQDTEVTFDFSGNGDDEERGDEETEADIV